MNTGFGGLFTNRKASNANSFIDLICNQSHNKLLSSEQDQALERMWYSCRSDDVIDSFAEVLSQLMPVSALRRQASNFEELSSYSLQLRGIPIAINSTKWQSPTLNEVSQKVSRIISIFKYNDIAPRLMKIANGLFLLSPG
jgi:hypothetical protein